MTPQPTTARDRAITLLRRGLVTQAEAARLAGVTRQHVEYWCRVAAIDPLEARALLIAALWRETGRQS